MTNCVEGRIIDIENREIFCGSIHIENGVIKAINKHDTDKESYILPGFIDAHVHIESSMLTPENFGNAAIKHGTVAVVTDPHEIANVLGVQGIEFMVENSKNSPVKTFFTVPSCVPATPFDVSGAVVSKEDVEKLFSSGKFVGLSEMMNVPGVIFHDDDVISKIEIAKKYNLPIDGHAPLLRGDDLSVYVKSGMSTDHECVTLEEAHEKISLGMKVIIREGSAALNYETLKPLISESPNDVMFCTDDSHPHEILSAGHIKKLVVRSICNGFDLYDVLKVASINPINHYNLDVGRLRVGDKADFIVVDNIIDFNVQEVYINGEEQLAIERVVSDVETVNNFTHDYISVEMLKKAVSKPIKVISLVDGELITVAEEYKPMCSVENLESDIDNDIVKIVYINRYTNGEPQVAFCRGFGLKMGAFASSVAHDSHNIIAVGCADEDIVNSVNKIIDHKGGLSVSLQGSTDVLPLPIGGIMCSSSAEKTADDYERLNERVQQMGCRLSAPFMTLSFLSLVVIPELKIGEMGLFSYSEFNWIG